eukprot:1195192-Prorocentrum_minimum.AAC.3
MSLFEESGQRGIEKGPPHPLPFGVKAAAGGMAASAQGFTLNSAPLRTSNLLHQHVASNSRLVQTRPVLRHGRTRGVSGSMNRLATTLLKSSLSHHVLLRSSVAPLRGKPDGFKEYGRARTHVCTATSLVPEPKVNSGDKEIANRDRSPNGGKKQTKHRLVMMRHSSSITVAPGFKVIYPTNLLTTSFELL